MLRIYIIGISILFVAIISNTIAKQIGISTWYDFLTSFAEDSSKNFTILDYSWLFVFYPFILGMGYKIGDFLLNLLKL